MNSRDKAKLGRLEARLGKLQKRADAAVTAVTMRSPAAAVRALTTPEGAAAMGKAEYKRLARKLLVPGGPTPAKPAGGSGERGTITERKRR